MSRVRGERFTTAIGHAATRRPWTALVASVLVCVLFSLPALGVRLDTDFYRLLPDGAKPIERFREMVHHFGSSDRLFIAIEAAPDAGEAVSDARRAQARALVERIASEVEAFTWRPAGGPEQRMVPELDGRPTPGFMRATEDLLVSRSWLLLDPAGVDEVVKRLQPRVVGKYLAAGDAPQGLPSLTGRDPLRLWTRSYLPYWQERMGGGGTVRRDGGYLVALGGRYHVLVLQPARSAQDNAFATDLVARCEAMAARLGAEPSAAGLSLRFAGGHFIAAADFKSARSNSLSNLWQGALGVLLLFGLAYRSLRLVVFIAVTMIPACAAALGLSRLFLGPELSLVASSFATILIGLGVDFIIHLYNAYGHELKRLGGSVPGDGLRAQAAEAALRVMAPSILAGVLTTVVAFAVLGFSEFRGLRELGIVAALGLSLMLVQLMVALPAYLAVLGPRRIDHPTHLGWYAASLVRRRGLYAAAVVVVVAASLVVLAMNRPVFVFDAQPRNLRPAHDPVFIAQQQLGATLGLGADRFQVMLLGRDAEGVVESACDLSARVATLAAPLRLTLAAALPPRLPAGTSLALAGSPAHEPGPGPRLFDTPLGRLRAEAVEAGRLRDVSWVPGHGPAPGSAVLEPGAVATLRPLFADGSLPVAALASPERQRQVLARLGREIDWPGLAALEADLDPATRQRWAPFLADLADMRARIADRRPLLPGDLLGTPLGSAVRPFYSAGPEDGVARMLVRFEVADLGSGISVGDLCLALGLTRDGGEWPRPGVTAAATGVPVVTEALQQALLADFATLALFSGLAVVVLLVLLMQTLRDVTLSLLSLLVGLLVMLAVMHLTGQKWNLVNLAVMPLLLGIGIDSSIYFVNALRRHPRTREGLMEAVGEIGHPMLMTSATAIIGFGSLFFNSYRGLQSMGVVAVIGMATCLVVALVGLPVLALYTSHRRSAPPAVAETPAA